MNARSVRRLKPVPDEPGAEPGVAAPLHKELPKRKLAAIRRRVEAASVRPAPGGSDLLGAECVWIKEEFVGFHIFRAYDCTRMTSLALAGGKAVSRSVRAPGLDRRLSGKEGAPMRWWRPWRRFLIHLACAGWLPVRFRDWLAEYLYPDDALISFPLERGSEP